MKKLYDMIDWKVESIMPEMKDCKKFDEYLVDICKETEITDPDFKKLKEPVYNLNYGGLVIVMGLPIVEKEKIPKLKSLFDQKLFPSVKVNPETDLDDFEIEFSQNTNMSTGNAIIKFKEEEKAIKAADALNGILIPPKYKLTVLTLSEFEDATASYNTNDDFPHIDHVELSQYLQENIKLEKIDFALAHAKNGTIDLLQYDYYDKVINTKQSIESSFIPKNIIFSQSGNLLIAIMGNHFEIYGTNEFKLLRKFQHKLVSTVKFSRRDRYAISFNGPADLKFGSENLIVWNVITGDKIRSFQVNSMFHFESFAFSHSEKYLSGIVKSASSNVNMVCVYELPKCQLLLDQTTNERVPLNIEGVLSMSWAPKEDALFVASCKESKSEINIYELPSKKRIPWMSIPFKVDFARPFWGEHQKSILVNMHTLHKKKTENTIHLGTVDWLKKQCYVNILTLENTNEKSDIIVSPNGLFFVILNPQKIGTDFEFYAVEEKNKSMVHSLLYKLQNQTMKYVSFSTFSNFLVLYNEQKIWFAEIKTNKNKHEFKLIREVDHQSEANKAVWSPCGRFVCFPVKSFELFIIDVFDFIGRKMCSQTIRDVKDFVIRPLLFRKECALNQKERDNLQKSVQGNMKESTEEDKKIRSSRKFLSKMKQNEGFEKLLKYLEAKSRLWEDMKPIRVAKMGFDDEAFGEMVQISRHDKDETIEELDIKN